MACLGCSGGTCAPAMMMGAAGGGIHCYSLTRLTSIYPLFPLPSSSHHALVLAQHGHSQRARQTRCSGASPAAG